jgi:peptidyl-prolyl cis-trans isomerase SurA
MRLLLVALSVVLFSAPAAAQDMPAMPTSSQDQLVDRVAAVVGDSIILMSQITEQMLRMQAGGVPLPSDPSELAMVEGEVLEDLVNQQLLLQAAARDTTIAISDARVEETLRDAWDDQVERFGSEAALREALEAQGQSLASYRATLRDEIRRSLLLQSYIQTRRQEARLIPVEEAEVEAYFQRERERLGRRPATLSFRQVVLLPQPSDSAKAAAKEEAERILDLIRDGEDFADLARRFSTDPGSRQAGGDLGWYRRGAGLVQEFEDAAFGIREGMITGPVETMFGAHIIKVERVRGAERKIHHILIGAEVSESDVERTRNRAAEIRAEVTEGASIGDFSGEQRDLGLPDSLEITQDQLDQLPSGYAQALRNAQPDQVLGPVEFPAQGNPAFAVIQVLGVRDEGEYSLEDLRAQIRERIRGEKFEERLIQDLRDRAFVEVRR